MKKIGIFGGTFDPVHNGHVLAALAFLEQSDIEKLYVIPTAVPPHKMRASSVSAEDRLRMCELAFEPCPGYGKRLFVSDHEIREGGRSYTVQTLRHFAKEADAIELLCGTDMFLTLDGWYMAPEIFARADIAYIRREKDSSLDGEIEEKKKEYEEKYGASVRRIDVSPFELSSSEVRDMLEAGNDVSGLVPLPVLEYIEKKRLYKRGGIMITEEMLSRLREDVKDGMSEKRYRHTLGVEREAAALCAVYAPEKKNEMRAAALLHDITKEYSLEKQLKICERFGIIVNTLDKMAPKTFHAKTAAALLGELYPEYDIPDIVSAVRYHTTGRADMSICECILYLADYIEDTRTFPDCVRLRGYFYTGLAKCGTENDKLALLYDTMTLSFDMTIKGLVEDGVPICHDTTDARNSFIVRRNEIQEFL